MKEYPYCTVTGKLSNFFNTIRDVGTPPKVTYKWLEQIGFKSTNDRSIIPVLKLIGFIDSSGIPTQHWNEYKNKSKSEKIMAEAIRNGYSELFDLYPNAQHKNREDIDNFFAPRTKGGSQVRNKLISTFTTLCDLADFTIVTEKPIAPKEPKAEEMIPEVPTARTIKTGTGMTININIQLTVPETTDEKVYAKFFEAMKKYLLS